MFQLHDLHGYSINPKNICAIEVMPGYPGTVLSAGMPSMVIHGRSCRNSYSYGSMELIEIDLRGLGEQCKSYRAQTSRGDFFMNLDNIFAVGPVNNDPHYSWKLEIHFIGGFRNAIDFVDPDKVRQDIMEKI